MRPALKKLLQSTALMTGAATLVLSSAGMVGAAEGEQPGNRPAAMSEQGSAEERPGANDQDRRQSPAAEDGGTVVTEDNDTNDGDTPNDVVDDGDNRHPSGQDRSVENGNSENQGDAQSDPDDDGRGPERTNGGADQPGGPGGDDLADQDGNNGCGNDDDFEDDNEGRCMGRDGAPGQQPEDDADEDVDEEIEDDEEEIDEIEDDDEDLEDDEEEIEDDDENLEEDEEEIEDVDEDEGGGVDVADREPVQNEGRSPEADVRGDVVSRPATPAVPTVSPAVPPARPQPAAVLTASATPDAQVLGAQATRTPTALAATGATTANLVPFGVGLVLLGFGLQRRGKHLTADRAS